MLSFEEMKQKFPNNFLTIQPHAQSPADFCEQRNVLTLAHKVMETYPKNCLIGDKGEQYTKLARDGDYLPVLGAIWKDKENRLAFLSALSSELHAPLMFEEAIACFVASPKEETLNTVSIPLIKAAVFRVQQDTKCCKDPSVYNGDLSTRLQMVYTTALEAATTKYLKVSLEDILEHNSETRIAAIKAKVKEVATQSQTQVLPPPQWTAWHGMNAITAGKIQMYSSKEFQSIRNNYAQSFLDK